MEYFVDSARPLATQRCQTHKVAVFLADSDVSTAPMNKSATIAKQDF
jgi:hypothetical protein